MKKFLLLITLAMTISYADAQENTFNVDIHSGKDNVIYMNYDTVHKKLRYFIAPHARDAKRNVDSKQNNINIYMQWINPLRYQLNWRDSIKVDPRDQQLSNFVGLLTAQFGSPLTSLTKSESNAALTKATPATIPAGETALKIPQGFNNADLNMLYLHLKVNQNLISNDQRIALNQITDSLTTLDDQNKTSYKNKVIGMFKSLYLVDDWESATSELKDRTKEMAKLSQLLNSISVLITNISNKINSITLQDALLNSLTKSVVTKFLAESADHAENNKELLAKLNPVLATFGASLKNRATNPSSTDYFLLREIDFEDGKILETKLSINKYNFDGKKIEYKLGGEIYSKPFVFKRYDFIKISVSSGLFYSNTTLPGYGVADQNGTLIVVEDNIKAKQAVTAIFANFTFDLFESRYLAPLVHLGIDPTKKRPFLLAGGGFAIPSAKLALTGGAIWTWTPMLDKLAPNGPVASTLDLEKDIKYEFNPSAKGFYIGVQYNF
jgi:hypothetical protein